MIKLNLETNKKEYEIIKEYLENNVSEELANKINNGVKIVKDNKTLINKKTLNTFMQYANEEARKLAQQGANYACIEDKTVFGWAIHYFEEDEFEGKLYNEDGTEYKPEIKITTPSKPITKVKQENKQPSLFDLLNSPSTTETKVEKNNKIEEEIFEDDEPVEDDDWTEEEFDEALKEVDKEIMKEQNYIIDKTTGEIIEIKKNNIKSIDKEDAIMLSCLLENKLTLKE